MRELSCLARCSYRPFPSFPSLPSRQLQRSSTPGRSHGSRADRVYFPRLHAAAVCRGGSLSSDATISSGILPHGRDWSDTSGTRMLSSSTRQPKLGQRLSPSNRRTLDPCSPADGGGLTQIFLATPHARLVARAHAHIHIHTLALLVSVPAPAVNFGAVEIWIDLRDREGFSHCRKPRRAAARIASLASAAWRLAAASTACFGFLLHPPRRPAS